jgi:hypothetical protein
LQTCGNLLCAALEYLILRSIVQNIWDTLPHPTGNLVWSSQHNQLLNTTAIIFSCMVPDQMVMTPAVNLVIPTDTAVSCVN